VEGRGGLYGKGFVLLFRTERDVLETVRDAVAKALEKLAPEQQGRSADVGEPKEYRDEEGKVKGYYLLLYGPHLKPFLKHAADSVEAMPTEVRVEGRRVVVKAGGVEAAVESR